MAAGEPASRPRDGGHGADGEGRTSAPTLGVVIVAAGQSSRMGGLDKQFALLGGRPVLAHALRVFAEHPAVGALVVVTAAERLTAVRRLAAETCGGRAATVAIGGARRQDSVRRGVEALPADCVCVAIHDGARPLITPDIIWRGLAALERTPAAVAVAPVADTIKRVDEAGLVAETLERARLRAAQTPQLFRLATLRAAYAAADWEREFTDEAALVEASGEPVSVFAGAVSNIKITTPHDLAIAEALWRLERGNEG